MIDGLSETSREAMAIRRWLDQRIEESRQSIEQPGLSEADTNVLRGEIRAFREMRLHVSGT